MWQPNIHELIMSVRKCEIVQQIKYLPGYPDHWRETLEARLEAEPNIKKWAYVLHDKDLDENGDPVEPHIHLVVELINSLNFSTIGNYVGVPAQFVTPIKQKIKRGKYTVSDVGGALAYSASSSPQFCRLMSSSVRFGTSENPSLSLNAVAKR